MVNNEREYVGRLALERKKPLLWIKGLVSHLWINRLSTIPTEKGKSPLKAFHHRIPYRLRLLFSAQRETKIGGWEAAHLAPQIRREFLYVDHLPYC